MANYLVEVRDKFSWQPPVEDKDLTSPPSGPSKGDRYLIISGDSGSAWTGQDNNITQYNGSSWDFITATEGMFTWIKDENKLYYYNGSSWTEFTSGATSTFLSLTDTPSSFLGKGEQLLRVNSSENAVEFTDEIEDKLNTAIDNIILNAFRLQIQNGLSLLNYEDGFTDEYEDETGIDTGSSTYESYNSTNDYYQPDRELAGIDSNTKLMLHCNGEDESTIFTDDSPSEHSVTAHGDAQVDTDDKKWGTGALLLDNGQDDHLSIPDSVDFDVIGSNSDNWTVDFWAKHSDHIGTEWYMIHQEDGNNWWGLLHQHANGFMFGAKSGGTMIIDTGYVGEITDSNWHHIAMCKVGNEYGLYKDGVQVGYTQDDSTDTFNGNLKIGGYGGEGLYGSMDEIRIQHSNAFEASPNSGKTDTIIVPTGAYSEDTSIYNMTLISDSQSAEEEPNEVRIVILEENIDAITINTDLKAYISKDGGSTWAQATLTDEGDFDSSKRILIGVADLTASGIGSGTNIEYKLTSLNNKDLRIHATGLNWR